MNPQVSAAPGQPEPSDGGTPPPITLSPAIEEEPTVVQAIGTWQNNAELIADASALGYLDGRVLDATYGLGRFWTKWQPAELVGCDADPAKAPDVAADFTRLPFRDRSFDSVVYDPPYRLNGTPDQAFDAGYGISDYRRWQDRMDLIVRGVTSCARVADRYLLVKCQDQVCSGQVRWQTDDVTETAVAAGFRKRDRFDLVTAQRPQPSGRSQKHARRNHSTLLIFQRTRS